MGDGDDRSGSNGTTGTAVGGNPAPPSAIRQLPGKRAEELGRQAAVFEDLQYVLRCCEHLVEVLERPDVDPVLVEALWAGAVVGYVRCFSGQATVLTRTDLDELELEGAVGAFHDVLVKLRDQLASRHLNPRERFTIGGAQDDTGAVVGVAVVGSLQPGVDLTTVRQLGRIAYGLSGLLDARMQDSQQRVLGIAQDLSAAQLAQLPLVQLDG